MTEREQVIAELLYLKHDCLEGSATDQTLDKAIALLKAQEPATIEPKRNELSDETKAWLDKMDAVDALGTIAEICTDWDGYRTADELGGLINEIWAYARYCAARLLKAQEPRVLTLEEVKQWCGIHPHKQSPIWVEFQRGHGTDGWRVGLVNSGLLAWCKDNEARCWTSRPTDEQREAVKWDG